MAGSCGSQRVRDGDPEHGGIDDGAVAADGAALTRFYRANKLSETSRHHLHAIIKTAYAWAFEEELVTANPAKKVKHPPRLAPGPQRTWTDQETATAIKDAAGTRLEVPIALAGWAGLRRGEICALRWEDIDLDHGVLASDGPCLTSAAN